MNQMTSLILLIISSLLMNLTIAVLPEVFAYENGQPITLPTTKKQGLFVTGLDVRDPNDEDLIAHPLPTQAIHTTTIKVLNQNVKIYGWEIPFGTDIAFEVAMGKWRKLGVTSITTSCMYQIAHIQIVFILIQKQIQYQSYRCN